MRNYLSSPATPAEVLSVLHDLSHEEASERDRLGISSSTLLEEEASAGRANAAWDFANLLEGPPLAIFGATEQGAIWMLPTQFCAEHHKRLLSERNMAWIIRQCFEIAGNPSVLANGVTLEGGRIIDWLKRTCHAKFFARPVATQFNGRLALPFVIHRPPQEIASV